MEDEFRIAREKAIVFIGIAQKSSGKVADFLLRKDISSELVRDVVASLIEDGYIDDYRVAVAAAKKRRGRSAESRQRLSRRLLSLGISEAAAQSCVLDVPSDEESIWELISERLLPERRKMSAEDDDSEWKLWAARFLAGRGYAESLIRRSLDKAVE